MKDIKIRTNEQTNIVLNLFNEYFPISDCVEGSLLDNLRFDNLKEIPKEAISYIEENFDEDEATVLIDSLKKGHSYIELLEYPLNSWSSDYIIQFTNKDNDMWYKYDKDENNYETKSIDI